MVSYLCFASGPERAVGVAAVSKKIDMNMRDVLWVLALGSQVGLSIALPVIAGLALGYWIDMRLGSLPWITLLLTLIGAAVGPVITYRWVISSVQRRLEDRKDEEESG
jgi:predicted F0F1-ATPase subunit